MKTLNDLFDKEGVEKVTAYAEYQKDDVKLGSEIVLRIFAIYSEEMNVKLEDVKLSTEKLTDLFNQFIISAALWINVNKGFMKMTGRIHLTNDKGTFKMTTKGNNYVLNMKNEQNLIFKNFQDRSQL